MLVDDLNQLLVQIHQVIVNGDHMDHVIRVAVLVRKQEPMHVGEYKIKDVITEPVHLHHQFVDQPNGHVALVMLQMDGIEVVDPRRPGLVVMVYLL
jgi:hypothetical protein